MDEGAAPLRPILAEASRLGGLAMVYSGLLVAQSPPVLPQKHPQYRTSCP